MKTRIKQARLGAKLTQQQLGDALGLSRGAVSLWESLTSPELPTLSNLSKISVSCKVSMAWLVSGDGDNYVSQNYAHTPVPVITWCDAAKEIITMEAYKTHSKTLISCPIEHSDSTYALKVIGDSMASNNALSRSYPDGCIIYCDPEQRVNVATGTPVIAYLHGSSEATFKVYIKDGSREWLKSINDEYPAITDAFDIRATVIGSFHF